MALKFESIYQNPYQQLREQFRANKQSLYNDEDFTYVARGNSGDLDMYFTALGKMPQTEQELKKFEDEYLYNYGDTTNRIASLYNEAFADRTTKIQKDRYVTDNEGNYLYKDGSKVSPTSQNIDESQLQTEKYETTAYDYYKQQIRNRNMEAYQKAVDEQFDKDKGAREKAFSAVGLFTEFGKGAVGMVNSILKWLNGVGEAAKAVFEGKSWDEISEARVKGTVAGGTETLSKWEKAILDWEIENTTLYNKATGEYTTVGKYIGGIGDTLGKMVPSFLLNLCGGKIMGSVGNAVGQSAIGAISQGMFYTGVDAQIIEEMYNKFADAGVTIPYSKILLNADAKSALQMAVESGLAKIMGASALDNLAFGKTQKITASKTLSRAGLLNLISSGNEEGLEEVFQDFTDLMVDKFMSLTDENFGKFSEWTPQTFFDSYTIAFITSFAGAAVRVATTRNIKTGKVVLDKDGKPVVKGGTIQTEKLNKLASYAYNISLQQFMTDCNEVIEMNDKLKNANLSTNEQYKLREKYADAAVNVYKSLTTLSQLYEEMGEVRFRNAVTVLSQMENDGFEEYFAEKTLPEKKADLSQQIDKSLLITTGEDLPSLANKLKYNIEYYSSNNKDVKIERGIKLLKRLAEARITQVDATFTKAMKGDEDAKAELNRMFPGVAQKVDKVLTDANGKIETVYITKDGVNIVFDEDNKAVYVPSNYIQYAVDNSNNLLYRTIAEQNIVTGIAKGTFKGDVLNKILATFREVSNKSNATIEDAVMNVMFNESFFNVMLVDANIDMYQFLTSLYDMSKAIVPNDVMDSVLKNKLEQVLDNMKTQVKNYLINQQNASTDVSFLTQKDKKEVAMKRWCKNLYNRVVSGEKLTKDDITILSGRINAMNVDKTLKENYMSAILSDNIGDRIAAMNHIATYYYNVFMTEYDGRVYMPPYCVPNQIFNNWLQSAGLTIDKFTEFSDDDIANLKTIYGENIMEGDGEQAINALIAYRTDLFEKYTSKKYTFEYDNKNIIVKELKTNKQVGFSKYYANYDAVSRGMTEARKTIVTEIETNRNYIRELVNENVEKSTREYLSVNDLIVQPTLLKDTVQQQILKKYKEVTPDTTFLYLRDYVISRSKGNSSIVVKQTGQYVMASITAMDNIWKNGKDILSQIKDGVTLKELLKDQYVYGSIGDCKIKIVDDNTIDAQYVRFDSDGSLVNTLYISKLVLSSLSLKFAVSHEIQHVIQSQNQLNLGYDFNWIAKYESIKGKKAKEKLISDVRKHVPEIFKGKDDGQFAQIANDYVYLASGESQAYGLEGNSRYINFAPVIIQSTAVSNTIIMPWGTKYVLQGKEAVIAGMSIRKIVSDEVINDNKYSKFEELFANNTLFNSLNKNNSKDLEAIQKYNQMVDLKEDGKYGYILHKLAYTLGLDLSKVDANTEIPCCYIVTDIANPDNRYTSLRAVAAFTGLFSDKDANLVIANSLFNQNWQIEGARYSKQEFYLGCNNLKLKDIVKFMDFSASKSFDTIVLDSLYNTKEITSGGINVGTFYKDLQTGQFTSSFDNDYYTSNMPKDLSIRGQLVYDKKLTNNMYMEDLKSLTIEEADKLKKDVDTYWRPIKLDEKSLQNDYYHYRTNKLFNDSRKVFIKDIKSNNFDKDFEDLLLKEKVFDYVEKKEYLKKLEALGVNIYNEIPEKYYSLAMKFAAEYLRKWNVEPHFYEDRKSTDDNRTLGYTSRNIINGKTQVYLTLDDASVMVFSTSGRVISLKTASTFYNTAIHETLHSLLKMSQAFNANVYAFDLSKQLIDELTKLYNSGDAIIKGLVKLTYNTWKDTYKTKLVDDLSSYVEETACELFAGNYLLNFADYGVFSNNNYSTILNLVNKLRQELNIIPISMFNSDEVNNDIAKTFVPAVQSIRPRISEDARIQKYVKQGYTDVHVEYNNTGSGNWTSKVVYTNEYGKQISTDYQYENARYVTKEKQKSTNLKYFGQVQITGPMQQFIIEANENQLAPELWEKIGGDKKGTLTHKDIMDWLYNTDFDKMDSYTFNLVNDKFFGNNKIRTPQELQYFVDRTGEFYALRAVLKSIGTDVDKLMQKTKTEEEFVQLLDIIKSYPELYSQYTKLADEFNIEVIEGAKKELLEKENKYGKKYTQIVGRFDSDSHPIDQKNLRRLWLQVFDGSIDSAHAVGAIAKTVAFHNWRTSSQVETVKVGEALDTKGNKTNLDALENIAQDEDYGDFEGYVIGMNDWDKIQYMMDVFNSQEWNKLYKKYNDRMFLENKKEALEQFVKDKEAFKRSIKSIAGTKKFDEKYALIVAYFLQNRAELDATYALVEEKMFGVIDTITDQDVKQIKDARTPANTVRSIKALDNTIKKNVPKKYAKLVLKDNADILNDDLTVKREAYILTDEKGKSVYKDVGELNRLWDRVRNIASQARAGLYGLKDARIEAARKEFDRKLKEQQKQFDVTIKEQQRELWQKEKQVENLQRQIRIQTREVVYNGPVEMPRIFQDLLSNEFATERESRVQFEKVDKHGDFNRSYISNNFKKFLHKYAEKILSMDQTEVNQLVEFLCKSDMVTIGEDANTYNMVRMALMAYLLEGYSMGNWTISEEQRKQLADNLGRGTNISAQNVTNFRTLIRELHPEKIVAQSIKMSFGIDYPGLENDIEELQKATLIRDNYPGDFLEAREKLYRNALNAARNKKKNVFDVLFKIERTMMLSGPGTWIRNVSSNINVTSVNALSDIMMSLFPDRKKVEERTGIKQYKLVKTKIDDRTKNWIARTIFGLDESQQDLSLKDRRSRVKDSFYEQFKDVFISKYDENADMPQHRLQREAESNKLVGKLIAKATVKRAATEASRVGTIALTKAEKKGEGSWQYAIAKVIDKIDRSANAMVYWGISDDRFVRRKFAQYLGKMLTEDKIELTDGRISEQAMSRIADAYIMACNDYMHSTNIINEIERLVRTKLGPGAYFMYKQIVPFLGPSLNWFVEGLKLTPAGLIYSIVKYARLENTINKMEEKRQKGELTVSSRFGEYLTKRDLGKGIIGTVGSIIGLALGLTGKAGIDTKDDKLKIFVGDLNVDISALFAMQGILVGMMTGTVIKNYVDMNKSELDETQKRKLGFNLLLDLVNSSLDQMFIDSIVTDMFNTFRYSNSVGEYLMAFPFNSLQMFIPNMVKQLSFTNKYRVKYESGIVGKLERLAVSAIPSLSYALPHVIDPYTGEEQVAYKAWFFTQGWNKYMPLDIYPYNISDAEKEAILLGLNKGQLTGKYTINDNKVELNGKQVQVLNQKYGQLNSTELSKLMNNRSKYKVQQADGTYKDMYYREMSDKQKATVINRIMTNNNSYAKISVLTNMGYKYYASASEYDTLKKLGITKNVYKETNLLQGFVK